MTPLSVSESSMDGGTNDDFDVFSKIAKSEEFESKFIL